MFDPSYDLRKAYFDVLDGNVMYEDAVIPVVVGKVDQRQTEGDIYIKLSTQNQQQNNNKCYFAQNSEVLAEVIHRTLVTGGEAVVDNIGNQILELIFPTRQTTALTLAAPLQLSYARFESSATLPLEKIDRGFLQVKSIIFSNRVIQPT